MDSRLVVARRELASLRREKTIVLALAIQLFVAAFSSFLVVGLVSLYAPGATAGAYVVTVGVAGNASGDIAPAVSASGARTAIEYENPDLARNAFQRGEVDAVVVADRLSSGRTTVEAVAPEGSFETTLVVTQLKDALSDYERQQRAALSERLTRQPLDLPPERGGNPYFGFTYTVLVPVLAFLPAFISGSIAADSVAEELDRGTFELLRAAPLSVANIVDGKALAFVAIAPAQAACWFAFLALNGTPLAHPLATLGLVGAVATVLVGAGIATAILAPKRREAQLLYSFGALAAFGVASLLPESPQNVVAKLAIGSPTTVTWLSVAGALALGAAGYAAARLAADRAGGA
ncbi:ABC transporter permease [Halarchaeum sp. P4]|uniref:ABC transporter permease n=1 Tax=Halarchaeum sp. P4 TaxID=3421639 RepID=UPI003EC07944